jgi:hypothetical protein
VDVKTGRPKGVAEVYAEMRRCLCGTEYIARRMADGSEINAACHRCNSIVFTILKAYPRGL